MVMIDDFPLWKWGQGRSTPLAFKDFHPHIFTSTVGSTTSKNVLHKREREQGGEKLCSSADFQLDSYLEKKNKSGQSYGEGKVVQIFGRSK